MSEHSEEDHDAHEETECSGWGYLQRWEAARYQYQPISPWWKLLHHLSAETDGCCCCCFTVNLKCVSNQWELSCCCLLARQSFHIALQFYFRDKQVVVWHSSILSALTFHIKEADFYPGFTQSHSARVCKKVQEKSCAVPLVSFFGSASVFDIMSVLIITFMQNAERVF